MKLEELQKVLEKHKMWLKGEEGGERANLQGANLRSANLRSANLQSANLQSANLQSANLQSADLRDADLDYSCFPLWCGGSNFKSDVKLVYQLLAHVCTLECEGEEFSEIKEKILPYALKSHRAKCLYLKGQRK